MTVTAQDTAATPVLDAGTWKALSDAIAGLDNVVFDDPRVDTDLVRAEGVRYLTRLITGGVQMTLEGWDWRFPKLIKFLSPYIQFGLPAADCCYHWAAVHGDETYRITGLRGTSRLFDVETREGHTARLAQWRLHDRRSEFEVGADGTIEIVLSREEQPGNWVQLADGPGSIVVRQYYYDWLTEEPARLAIERDGAVYPPAPFTAHDAAERLELLHAWLQQVPAACQHVVGTHYAAPSDALEFGALDFGWADLQYGKGTYRCADEEAVIVEVTPPEAEYWGLQLSSHFWEARDWNVRQTSINGHQADLDEDGVVRAVIAHRDPGVPNWLDAGGLPTGLIALRYYKADSTPVPTIRTIPFDAVAAELPAGTPRISPQERQISLRSRALSVRRRLCD